MKSPFPGMDPYLEQHWLDVHGKLVAYAADALNAVLPNALVASIEERVAVESEGDIAHIYGPDVRVVELPGGSETEVESAGGVATAPLRLLAQVEPITERFIRILDARTERLITVIEFVSPTNKVGEGLYVFRAKRGELLASGVNFVEIDLVRSGDWRALMRPHRPGRKGASLYRAAIRIPAEPASVYLFPIHLRDHLPDVPVPLRRDDPEIKLHLQELLDRAYTNGRYDRRLDYHQPPVPPLEGEDAAWAEQLLKEAGRR